MLLFSGTYRNTLDDKNRLIVPAKFRETLAAEGVDKLFVVKGDSYLYVFPHPVFLKLYEDFGTWEFTEEANQNYARLLFSDAFDVTPDKQGRIGLRKDLCEEVGIDREAVIIGVLNRMELWSPERWQEFREKSTLRGFSADLGSRSQK